MTMNDIISNYLTRVRNAIGAKHETVNNIPSSKILEEISRVLKEEGYVKDFRLNELGNRKTLSVDIKYYNGKSVITRLERVSTPGRRVYTAADEIPYERSGLGISIISTSKGVMTDAKARELNIGGEIICKVW